MDVIRQSIFLLWSADLFLVCLPFFGFGIYYQQRTATCVRYKMATLPRDIGYAYLYITFGALLCICLVWCNLAVMRALCHMGQYSQKRRPELSRRISGHISLTLDASTREELAFARLMAFLCIIFVICWVPQLISVPLAQIDPDSTSSRAFFRTADILLALHFMLDPVLYVLQRWPFFRSHCCANGRHSRNSSMKTTTHELVSL